MIRSYDRDNFEGGSIFSDFMTASHLGWSDEYRLPGRTENPSLTIDAAYALRLIRMGEVACDADERHLRRAAEVFSEMYPGEKNLYPINNKERKALLAKYEEDSRYIETYYMDGRKIYSGEEKDYVYHPELRERDLKNAEIIARLTKLRRGTVDLIRKTLSD